MKAQLHITDRLLVLVLFTIMVVLSMVQFVNLHANQDQTDQIKEQIQGQRDWAEVVALCVLDTSGAINFEKIPYTPEAIEAYVKDCFNKEAVKHNIGPENGGPKSTSSTVPSSTVPSSTVPSSTVPSSTGG
jgi:hypothetical protein